MSGQSKSKVCRVCDKRKPVAQFLKQRRWCKKCASIYLKWWKAGKHQKCPIVSGKFPTLDFDTKYFDMIDSSEKAYWFGLICADGCHNKRQFKLKLCKKDISLLRKLKTCLKAKQRIYIYGNDALFRICSTGLCQQLDQLGCHNKSLTIKYPKKLLSSLNRDFIRGVFDGDGCFASGKYFDIVGGSKHFMRKIATIIRNECGIDVKTYISCKNRKNPLYSIRVYKLNDLRKLYAYLYGATKLFLKRKEILFQRRVR